MDLHNFASLNLQRSLLWLDQIKRKLNVLEKKGRFDPDLATFWMCGNIIAAGKNNTIIRFIPKLIQSELLSHMR
jgi:hypothetical protein